MHIEKPTISSLFTDAAKFIRSEFEYIRTSNPHPGEKGSETEEVLRQFLNAHLPKRFHAVSGFMISTNNELSRQTDIIIYDSLSSPVYRSSETTHIIPVDTVASVIEVKSRLNKPDLLDALEKIASCKSLNKTPISQVDQSSTEAPFISFITQGIIFGFSSDTSIEKLAASLAEAVKSYESYLWPDLVMVLDRGSIDFAIQFPDSNSLSNLLAAGISVPYGQDFIPPFFMHLVVHKDEKFTFNRFFLQLLAHITHYPRRPSIPPPEKILEGISEQVTTINVYQYDTKGSLRLAPDSEYQNDKTSNPIITLQTKKEPRKKIGMLEYIRWQDGAFLRFLGDVPLQNLLKTVNVKMGGVIINEKQKAQLSNVMNLSEEEFRRWPKIINKRTKWKAILDSTAYNK